MLILTAGLFLQKLQSLSYKNYTTMKNLFLIIALFFSLTAFSQGNLQIKFNLPDDPVSLNKVKVLLTGVNFDGTGKILTVSYIIKLTNQLDQDILVTSEIQDSNFFSKEKTFTLGNKAIVTATRVYSPLVNGVPGPGAAFISDYLQLKAINTFKNPNDSNLAGGDASWKFIQAVLKEIVLIKQANGELPL